VPKDFIRNLLRDTELDNSGRLERKNILLLAGKPLMNYFKN
jgi:hypothetical protein